MTPSDSTYVKKACAYITRGTGELLVFRTSGEDRLQVPKGTVEPEENPREALFREVAEESGLGSMASVTQLASDLWLRRPGRWYVRHFFHAHVHEPRDHWTHTVTGEGEERGKEFEFMWVDPTTDKPFAMDLDDYAHLLAPSASAPTDSWSGTEAGTGVGAGVSD